MTIEEALKYANGNKDARVLVAVYDFEEENGIAAFHKKTTDECENIIKEAETVASLCDDFIRGLRCFSVKQNLMNIKPKGKMSTILIQLE